MSDTEIIPAAHEDSETQNLREELHSMRQMFMVVVAILILFGLSFDLYMYRQVAIMNQEILNSRRLEQQVEMDRQKKEPVIYQLLTKLTDFGKAHPDFYTTVLAKYSNVVQIVPPQQILAPAAKPKK